MSETELAAYYAGKQQPTSKPKGAVRRKNGFTMMPDEWWVQMLRVDADKCTYRLAHYLLREAWRSGTKHVKVSNVGLMKVGVGRDGKRHALDQLERVGLISVERKNYTSPVVKVRYTD